MPLASAASLHFAFTADAEPLRFLAAPQARLMQALCQPPPVGRFISRFTPCRILPYALRDMRDERQARALLPATRYYDAEIAPHLPAGRPRAPCAATFIAPQMAQHGEDKAAFDEISAMRPIP